MKNTKLLRIIVQLSTKDLEIIRSSLQSPLLEGKKYHQALLDYLIGNIKRISTISRDEINRKIYDDKISDNQLRLRMSELFRLISTGMVLIHAKQDIEYHDNVLIDKFKLNEDDKLFESRFNAGKKRLENFKYRNVKYHEIKYDLGFKEYTHISSSSRTRDLNLQVLLDDVDHIFISKKIRQACFAMSHQSVYGQKYDYGLLEDILSYVRQNNLTSIPSIRLYYSVFEMLSNPKETKNFNILKTDIDQLKHLFPNDELQGIYRFAINQCIRLLNRGHQEYGSITLDLYEEALENNFLHVDGYLTRFTYRNIAAIAVKIGEFDRAATFTEQNKTALRKDERKSAFNFNQALISYHLQDFDTALQSIQLVDFKDHLFNLAAKVIQMKVYFESESIDLLESHLDAMQMYLLRKKVIGYHKTNYKNIIKMTRKLLKTNRNDKGAVLQIKQEIKETEILTEKKWLLKQISRFL